MKNFSVLLLATLFLAVVGVTVSYFVMDGDLPGTGGTLLIVATSLAISVTARFALHRRREKLKGKSGTLGVWLMVAAGAAALGGCSSRQAIVAVAPPPTPAQPPPTPVQPPPVQVQPPPPLPTPIPTRRIIDTGRALLYGTEREDSVYGHFSYLLFALPPASRLQRARYIAAIEAFLRTTAASEMEEQGYDKALLNIFYLPVTKRVPQNADSLLKYYNYARARRILLHLRVPRMGGVYVASAPVPLTYGTSGSRLVQRLTTVYPTMVEIWVRQFCEQATQPRFWEYDKREEFIRNLQNAIAVAANVTPAVRDSLKDLISWMKN